MLIKTLLNKAERFKSFICRDIRLTTVNGADALYCLVAARLPSRFHLDLKME
ncbi:MAG: hypothetical protein Q8R88_07220 [Desulfoprunum sp.]|nr:hypothetical protein [Desulfoprunum sp.]